MMNDRIRGQSYNQYFSFIIFFQAPFIRLNAKYIAFDQTIGFSHLTLIYHTYLYP